MVKTSYTLSILSRLSHYSWDLCLWQLIVNQRKASIGCVRDIFEPFAFVHFE